MNESRFLALFERMDKRLRAGIALLLFAFVAFESWHLLLREALADYRQTVASRSALLAELNQLPNRTSELEILAADLQRLTTSLQDRLQLPASDDKVVAALMEALDRSAVKHGVKLSGLKPLERRPVLMFEEVSFSVSALGNYLPLSAWMLDFERAVGNYVSITEADMKLADTGGRVDLTFKLSLYRLRPTEKPKS